MLIHSLAHSFTDFLVFEVDQDSKVIHLKNLGKPEISKKEKAQETVAVATPTPEAETEKGSENTTEPLSSIVVEISTPTSTIEGSSVAAPALKISTKEEPWPEHFDATLAPFLDAEKVAQLKKIFLEGPEPPRVSDGGWGGRVPSATGDESVPPEAEIAEVPEEKDTRGNSRGRGGKRGGRGGRGGGHGGGRGGGREDTRKVISAVRHYVCYQRKCSYIFLAHHIKGKPHRIPQSHPRVIRRETRH